MNEINYFQAVDVVASHDVRAMRAVHKQLHERVKVKPGEHVLIVGDFATPKEMIDAFAGAVAEAGAIPTIMIMPNSGWDPWPLQSTPIAENAMLYGGADLIINCEQTYWAGWGLPRPENPPTKRARHLTGSEQSWKYHGVFDIEKEEMEKYFDIAKRIGNYIGKGKRVRITGRGGTDITADIYGGGTETAIYLESLKKPGMECIWRWEGVGINGCEVDITVKPGTAEGVVVFDGPLAHVRGHGEPIRVNVEKGRIVSVEGSKDALLFRRLLARIKNMDQIVEMAAGLTPGWYPDGAIHAEKRGLGNTHVAFGGWYPNLLPPDFVMPDPYVHIDGTIYCGAMEIDGKKMIDEGKVFV